MGTADEAAFIELLIASERVQDWLDTIRQLNRDPQKLRPALMEMRTAVLEKEAYSEEARKAGAVPLLTSILKRVSTEDEDILDAISSIVTACSGPMASSTRLRTFHYGNEAVTVKEGALGDGVGAKVWTVAHILCHEIASNPSLVQCRTVLEIGSGCGACGLLAARLGASRVVLSDYVDQLLLNLREAMHLNGLDFAKIGKYEDEVGEGENPSARDWDPEEDGGSECSDLDVFLSAGNVVESHDAWETGNAEVRFVDWRESVTYLRGEYSQEGNKEPHYCLDGECSRTLAPGLDMQSTFDLVIGTDVLYEWSMAESVAATIAHRLKPCGLAIICNAVRDQAMFDAMVQNLRGWGLEVELTAVQPRVEDGGLVSSEQEYEGGYVMVRCTKQSGG